MNKPDEQGSRQHEQKIQQVHYFVWRDKFIAGLEKNRVKVAAIYLVLIVLRLLWFSMC